ncbi:hypothetical protein RRG08_042034 [Elysia crispata]|uniref:C-type lectin domain-containing protein n=1 Tax=Elysia crispata TaxID=231223 RepID=A0AAE0Z8H6_9GAST|nr:hypothetical protein RRG08_042034 [Elysia crispata]
MSNKSVLLLLPLVFAVESGYLCNFRTLSTRQNFENSETLCQDFGYDGLAVVSSPEMYSCALQLTRAVRLSGQKIGVYVGLRNSSTTNLLTWDDGTVPAEDTPWKYSSWAKDFTSRHYGNLHYNESFKSANPSQLKFALCGNHKNLPTEAHGRTILGQQPAGVSSSLSVTKVLSYLECVLLCGQDHRCRVAEFNFDLLTCLTLGPGSYTGFTPNSRCQVFIRNGFS